MDVGQGKEAGRRAVELIDLARKGDQQAFTQLVAPHQRELRVHCYRILGSEQDAEDALQETLLAGWQGLGGFDARASIRTWLYRIATNRCLNMLRATSHRPQIDEIPQVQPPPPTRMRDVLWLEPYPDVMLEGLSDAAPGPDARYEANEAISVAFLTAVQLLPAQQRAVLVLRDVLGFRAAEVAEMLGTTEQAVKSALKRARATIQQSSECLRREPPPAPGSATERKIVERFARAYEAADLEAVVALLTEDVSLTMPPLPFEYQGKADTARFLEVVAFAPGNRIRLIPTRANTQPAFGFYVGDRTSGIARAIGLLVLSLSGSKIAAIIRFEASCLPRFGLPRSLTH